MNSHRSKSVTAIRRKKRATANKALTYSLNRRKNNYSKFLESADQLLFDKEEMQCTTEK